MKISPRGMIILSFFMAAIAIGGTWYYLKQQPRPDQIETEYFPQLILPQSSSSPV